MRIASWQQIMLTFLLVVFGAGLAAAAEEPATAKEAEPKSEKAARKGPRLFDEVAEQRGAGAKGHVVDIAVKGLVHAEDEGCHRAGPLCRVGGNVPPSLRRDATRRNPCVGPAGGGAWQREASPCKTDQGPRRMRA